MAYDPGALDRTLAAAVGDDPMLVAELRDAFLDGAAAHLDTLAKAPDAAAWRSAAARLSGLAASFGARDLMRLALAAPDAPPRDPLTLARLAQAVARLNH